MSGGWRLALEARDPGTVEGVSISSAQVIRTTSRAEKDIRVDMVL
jgi:hypothetical protein